MLSISANELINGTKNCIFQSVARCGTLLGVYTFFNPFFSDRETTTAETRDLTILQVAMNIDVVSCPILSDFFLFLYIY